MHKSVQNYNEAGLVFAALGDVTRLQLVERLSVGQPQSIAQLTDGLGLTRQGVTKHLKILEQVGMVDSHREGRETRFKLSPEPIVAVQRYLEQVSLEWDEALARLKLFVEDVPE